MSALRSGKLGVLNVQSVRSANALLREPSGRTGPPTGAESVKVPAIFFRLLGGPAGEKETGRIGELGNRPRVPSGNLSTTHDADARRNTGILGHEESTFSASQI